MAGNLEIYEAVRHVPETARKEIAAGRLKGKTDINPVWRIKTLTEQFGPCGIGWKYKILDKRLEQGGNGEIAAFVDIDLYIKYAGEWSEGIPGTGGAMFVAKEDKGLHTSDECFKMALTDAISVSCKALGIGADVYWSQDATKYEGNTAHQNNVKPAASGAVPKPLIITTNLSLKEMQNAQSLAHQRIYDRVLELCPIRLALTGSSRRIENASARRDKAREILAEVETCSTN